MIEHIVLFKLKPDTNADQIDWIMRETRIQLLKIPFVLGLRCGYRIDSKTEWPFFLLVELESTEKLSIYMNDPSHVRFVNEIIKPNVTEWLILDFQTDLGEDPLLT